MHACPPRTLGVVEPADDVLQQLLPLLRALGAAPLVVHAQLQRGPAGEDEGRALLEYRAVLRGQLHPPLGPPHKLHTAQHHALGRHDC